MKIIKRDGREVEFDGTKIVDAINKANNEVIEKDKLSEDEIIEIAKSIEDDASESFHVLTVEEIQNKVEDGINALGKFTLGRVYSQYRFKRAMLRTKNTTDDVILSLIKYENEEVKQENSNKNPRINSVQRDYMAGEVSKDLTRRILLPEDIWTAHENGLIHFHDSDYFVQTMNNCGLVNLEDMLNNGTVISGTKIDKPHTFSTACNIATQIEAQVASSQYGGQSMTLSHLAPFVNESRKRFKKQLSEELELIGGINISDEKFNEIVEKRVKEDINKGVQIIQYQTITLQTTNGQAPFVTLFLYIDEVPEGQTRDDLVLIIEEVLRQRYQGVKNEKGAWITPAFPKLIYVLDEDNVYKDSKYYWLTELAAKCTSRRMVPDYISAKIMKEIKNGNVFPVMGCVEGTEVITYKINNKLYVESFERMWNRLSLMCKPKVQKGRKYDMYIDFEYDDLNTIEIYDKTKGFVNVKRVIRNFSDEWVRVKMSNGRVLTCTKDHPFHTENRGRVFAKDLIPGEDTVIINKSQYFEENIDMDPELAYALGVFLCVGHYDKSVRISLALTGEDDIIENICLTILKYFGNDHSYATVIEQHRGKKGHYKDVDFHHLNPKLSNELISMFGGIKKSDRHIPNFVFNLKRESRLAFMAGMIDAYGNINECNGSSIVQIGTTNKELAIQQLLLLQSLDIPSSMYLNIYDKKKPDKFIYRVECTCTEELINSLVCEKKKLHFNLGEVSNINKIDNSTIISIEELDKFDYSYDVTTDSDHFDVSGIYSHNCRSALSVEDNVRNKDGSHKFYGRFNQGVVTINLVDVALSSNKDFNKFWDILDERLELCHRALRCRHERLLGTVSDVAPILWQYGAYTRLEKGETIDKYLFGGYSTISLGYAGLYECVKYMTEKSHTHNEMTEHGIIPKDFAIKVMEIMNAKCNEWKEKENISYSVYGTPLESTTYKFAKCLQKRFGIIPEITDHNYITNSYHVNVREQINAFEKLEFESSFQKLSPGGAISYVETPNLEKNIDAILSVMTFIYNNIMYAELNTKSDFCQVCESTDEIKIIKDEESGKLIWRCPNCGNMDQNKMNVARRTCGYIGTDFWNQGRTQEIFDRVLHLDNFDFEDEK